MPIDNKTLLRVRSIVGAGGGGEGSEAVINSLSVTENGTYTAPSGVDGYSPVTVNVPEPTGTKTITANGTHDVKDYASAQVNVPDTPAVTEALTVTENGTYTPDTGVDGFDSVTVNVAGSGGLDFSQIPLAAFNKVHYGTLVPASDTTSTSSLYIGSIGMENVPPEGTPGLFVMYSPDHSALANYRTIQFAFLYSSDLRNKDSNPKGMFRFGAMGAVRDSGYDSNIFGSNFNSDGTALKYCYYNKNNPVGLNTDGTVTISPGSVGINTPYLMGGKNYHWFLLTY